MYKTLKKILLIGLIFSSRCYAAAEEPTMTKQEVDQFMEQVDSLDSLDSCLEFIEKMLDEINFPNEKCDWIYNYKILATKDIWETDLITESPLYLALVNRFYREIIKLIKQKNRFWLNSKNLSPFHILSENIVETLEHNTTITTQFKINIAFIKVFLMLYNNKSYEMLNQKTKNGYTPLIFLLLYSQTEIVTHPLYLPMLELLLDAGADPLVTNEKGLNHLQLLIKHVSSNRSPAYPFPEDIKPAVELLTNHMNPGQTIKSAK